MKKEIKYRIYNFDSQCGAKKFNKVAKGLKKIKLPKKEIINFKQEKGWTVYTCPVMEFSIGKKCYSFEFRKGKLVVSAFDWVKRKKNGDLAGIENWKTIDF